MAKAVPTTSGEESPVVLSPHPCAALVPARLTHVQPRSRLANVFDVGFSVDGLGRELLFNAKSMFARNSCSASIRLR